MQEAGILDKDGKLTKRAVAEAKEALSEEAVLKNPKVVSELTKDGSNITDWTKYATPSVTLSTGQRVQVHFYKNRITGKINYNVDFKVKGEVHVFSKTDRKEPRVPPYSPI